MEMRLEVRAARAEDAAGIARVHVQAWRETYAGMIDPDFLAARSEERSRASFERSGCRDMVVAVLGGEIVGFAGFAAGQSGDGELIGLYVLKKAQGRGVGGALLERALDTLREQGCGRAALWVLEQNHHAIGFYTHKGFAFSGGKKQETLGTPVTELRYVKELL